MKYLIIGDGYVGNYFARVLPDSKIFRYKIHDNAAIEKLLWEHPDHILINCAGKTGKPNVDWCEYNQEVTFRGNVETPVMIAETCRKMDRKWVHIGSGCVYTGYEKEWTEDDAPNFFGSFYSRTKFWSQDILKAYEQALVLRIRMPIDENLMARCYISKIVKYARDGKQIFDLPNSMTILCDLASALYRLTAKGLTGEFNVVNKDPLKISQILDLYKHHRDPGLGYDKTTYEEVRKTMVADRSNCVLSGEKLEQAGIVMPSALERVTGILRGEVLCPLK